LKDLKQGQSVQKSLLNPSISTLGWCDDAQAGKFSVDAPRNPKLNHQQYYRMLDLEASSFSILCLFVVFLYSFDHDKKQ
jgi:hypothetical protein